MNLQRFWKAACGACLLACCAAALAAPGGVIVNVTPERQSLGRHDDVVVKVTITNASTEPLYVLKWLTPFEGDIEAPLFEVTRDGNPVRYLGIRAKRAAPGPNDYLRLEPGAARTARVELSGLYEMNITGAYTVRYHAAALALFGLPGLKAELGQLQSDPASIWIDGPLPRGTLPPAAQAPQGPAGLAFKSCSNAQQADLASAAAAGLAMATDGQAYLDKGKLAARFSQWFGEQQAQAAATAKAHFAAIREALADKPVTVDCGCNKAYYAYVYADQPYVVHVCRAFWSAPMKGTDSKGGTLVHEISHFTVVAGTNDWAYGQARASELATSDPARALDNADSHEYFGENSPELPVVDP